MAELHLCQKWENIVCLRKGQRGVCGGTQAKVGDEAPGREMDHSGLFKIGLGSDHGSLWAERQADE